MGMVENKTNWYEYLTRDNKHERGAVLLKTFCSSVRIQRIPRRAAITIFFTQRHYYLPLMYLDCPYLVAKQMNQIYLV